MDSRGQQDARVKSIPASIQAAQTLHSEPGPKVTGRRGRGPKTRGIGITYLGVCLREYLVDMLGNFGSQLATRRFIHLCQARGKGSEARTHQPRTARSGEGPLFQKKESRRDQRREWTGARAGRGGRRGALGDRAKQHRGRGVWEGGKRKWVGIVLRRVLTTKKNWLSGFPCNFSPVPQKKSGVPWRRPAVSAATLPARCVFFHFQTMNPCSCACCVVCLVKHCGENSHWNDGLAPPT